MSERLVCTGTTAIHDPIPHLQSRLHHHLHPSKPVYGRTLGWTELTASDAREVDVSDEASILPACAVYL